MLKSKVLNGIIQDLMKVPLHGGGGEEHGAPASPKGVHVTIAEMGEPKEEGSDPLAGHELDDEAGHDPMKKHLMEKAIHAKSKGLI